MKIVIQIAMPEKSRGEAEKTLSSLCLQEGYLGGRIIGDGRSKPWAAQAFFPAEPGMTAGDKIDDNTRVVLLPGGIIASFEEKYRKALEAADEPAVKEIHYEFGEEPEDTLIYVDFPSWLTKEKDKINFKEFLKEWAKKIRSQPYPNPMDAAFEIERQNPIPIGRFGFGSMIESIFDRTVRSKMHESAKKGSFVRIHVRTPAGKKIWFST